MNSACGCPPALELGKAVVRPVSDTGKLHPMTHVLDGMEILCGFDDFVRIIPDGSKAAGNAYHSCDDCNWIAEHKEDERLAFDVFVDSLQLHETEEIGR